METEHEEAYEKLTNFDNDFFSEVNTQTSKGENYYARQFKTVYVKVRKGLVLLKSAKKTHTNEAIVTKTRELLQEALDELN